MNAKQTHEYNELTDIVQIFHKTGTKKILWGLFEYPSGWHERKTKRYGVCRICLQKEFTGIHGYPKINKIS